MNRHHPYGGPPYNEMQRRGGSPLGPGPDRSFPRFSDRGSPYRGRGRGRGGPPAGTYNNASGGGGTVYSSVPSGSQYGTTPGDNYHQWSNSQDPYFNQPPQYGGGAPQYGGYDQSGYGEYEDGPGFERGRGSGRGRRGTFRRERDDKVHDSLIEERIQRERPCRTLFIRNIKYETDSNDVRHKFEEHGDIKTFFDLIANRGMVFVTYYDIRAAERARERLQDTEISGRPIDVHYSLPRNDDQNGKEPKDRNQGILVVTLRNSISGQPINDVEVRRKFSQFGDVKEVKIGDDPHSSRVVEFYDIRACEAALETLIHQGLQDGLMDILFVSDQHDNAGSTYPPRRPDERRDFDDHNRGRRGMRGGRGRGRGGPPDDWDRRDDWNRDRDRGRRYEDESVEKGPRGGYHNRYDARDTGHGGPPDAYNGNPVPSSIPQPGYAQNSVSPNTGDDRLEQARKVQQLLQALKQPQAGAGSAPPTAPPSSSNTLSVPTSAPAPPASFYPQSIAPSQTSPAAPYPAAAPIYPPIHQSVPPQQVPPAPGLNALPPNILALLQQAQPQLSPGNMAPSSMSSQYGTPMSPQQPGYEQLMAAYMQSQSPGKSHQKVVLDVDFSGALRGYTEITIIPTSIDLRTIYLHSRQCHIHSVKVGTHHADFIHNDPTTSIATPELRDCHKHPQVKRKLFSALAECDEGELAISIPPQVKLTGINRVTTSIMNEASTPEPQTPGSHQVALPTIEFSPIVIHIEYSLHNPVDGIEFVLPSDNNPYRAPHVYTTPSSPDAARCWMPCLDNLWDRHSWEFEFVVPKYLEEPDTGLMDLEGDETSGETSRSPTVVICSGELVEQVAHPFNSTKTIFLFSQPVPTSAQHVAFAAGPFHVWPVPMEGGGIAEDSSGSQVVMHAFCLPGHEGALSSSVPFLRSAMNFYTTEFGSYPFVSYKVVFVDELPTQRFDSATLSLISVDLLHWDDAIDQVYETRQALSHALACQWVGINILPKTWSDLWLVNGLSLYISALYMKKLLGTNEYRFRLKKDMDRVVERDDGSMPPICQPSNSEPPDPADLPFISLKAPLVLYILDRRLGKSGTSLGLSRVLPKVFLTAISGEMPNNALSTHSFLRTCRKVSGVDLRSFVDQWIYGSGCPQFSFLAQFNRKKMAVEIQMRQECPAYLIRDGDPLGMTLKKPVPFFEGQMTVRIHEADGTPYEHVLDILAPVKRFEVPFNTKYKRVRRNTKRYLARQAAAQAAAEGDPEAAEAMGMIDMGFGLEIWENEEERDRWKVSDWTEEEEQAMAGATYEWIRMDADFEWIAKIHFEQADFMWVSQLQRDRDVVAQMEAIHSLARSPTFIVSSTLTKTVLVNNYFFRIRCEAAMALVTCAIRRLDFRGLFHLLKLFMRYCYDPEDPNQLIYDYKFVPRPNDFSDFCEYFVRKSVLQAISQVRLEDGKSPAVVRKFFIDQLRYNDNTTNPYSDAYYICTIISMLGCAIISTSSPERGELLRTEPTVIQTAEDVELTQTAISEVERYRSMDRLIPSFHNVVTVAALEFHLLIGLADLISVNPKIFLPSTREGNATQVRLAGFDGLFLSKWYAPKVMRYIFAVLAHDPSRVVRRYVARNMLQSLAIMATVGEIKHASKDSESLLIEEDSSLPEKAKEAKKNEVDQVIRSLRKDKEVGRNEVLREYIMPLILSSKVDYEVRWCMLKLAEMAVREAEEPLPKVTICLPPTPVTEAPLHSPLPTAIKVLPKTTLRLHPKENISVSSPLGPPNKIRIIPSTPHSPSLPGSKLSIGPKVSKQDKVPIGSTHIPQPKPVLVTKKEKVVPKARSGGMSMNELKACRNALKKLMAHKKSLLFRQPVDPVRDRAPNYFEVIKKPIDLSTMGAKLEAGMYKDRSAFEADFRTMIENCQLYNSPGTYAYNESVTLDGFFEKQWTRIINTLEAVDTKQAKDMPPPPPPAHIPRVEPHLPVLTETKASVIKPTIKLKLGPSQPTLKPEPAKVEKQKEKEKPKPIKLRKPKKVEPSAAVPASLSHSIEDFDDGSNDLLEEVLAIERERDGDYNRSAGAKVVEKRKREDGVSDEVSDEDEEILNLAGGDTKVDTRAETKTPTSTTTKTTSTSQTPSQSQKSKMLPEKNVVPQPSQPVVLPTTKEKTSTPPVKIKKTQPQPQPQSPPVLAPSPSVLTTPINEKKSRDLLKLLLKLPQAAIFSRAVDPIVDGCPTYYDEIKNPMDLGTMRQKLDQGQYSTMEEFANDMNLIFSNCRQFNPPTTGPTICADVVERAFKKELPKLLERKLSFQEKRSLLGIMTKLQNDTEFWVFREPVDPVLLQIPTYYDVIPRKDARDLRTIRGKLEADKYVSKETWEADIELMVNNAIKFNGEDSEVGKLGVKLLQRVRELLVPATLQQGKKRQAPETNEPNKKQKVT